MPHLISPSPYTFPCCFSSPSPFPSLPAIPYPHLPFHSPCPFRPTPLFFLFYLQLPLSLNLTISFLSIPPSPKTSMNPCLSTSSPPPPLPSTFPCLPHPSPLPFPFYLSLLFSPTSTCPFVQSHPATLLLSLDKCSFASSSIIFVLQLNIKGKEKPLLTRCIERKFENVGKPKAFFTRILLYKVMKVKESGFIMKRSGTCHFQWI